MAYTFTKYSAGGGNASLPPNQLHEGSTADEIAAALEEYLTTGKAMIWTDSTNYETCSFVAFLDDGILYFMKGSTKQLIAVALGDTVSWSYIDLAGAGGSGGGLSIKEITFTDRPSAWEWLCNNHQKVLKSFITLNTMAQATNFTSCFAAFSVTSNSEIKSFIFTDTIFAPEGDVRLCINSPYFELDGTQTIATMMPNAVTIDDDGTISVFEQPTQTFPDEYWAVLECNLTCYYIG